MRGVNDVVLLGNLGGDPEVKYTQGGSAVARFSVATTEAWTTKDGEKKEETSWHRVVAFKRLAEVCGEYLAKGDPVFIKGSIKYGKYTDKDGVERYSTDIVAREMRLLGGKRDGGKPQQSRQAPPKQSASADDFADDDIPF